MPKKHCCYVNCNSDTRYKERSHMDGIFFISFPKPTANPAKCEKWIKACGRVGFTEKNVKRHMTYICSKHFVGGHGPTPEHPDPIPATQSEIFLGSESFLRSSINDINSNEQAEPNTFQLDNICLPSHENAGNSYKVENQFNSCAQSDKEDTKKYELKRKSDDMVLKEMTRLRSLGLYCDAKLKTIQGSILVHRLVLASNSRYFEALLQPKEFDPYKIVTIEIPSEYDLEIMNLIVSFMYCGKLCLNAKTVDKVEAALVYFTLPHGIYLCNTFREFIKSQKSPKSDGFLSNSNWDFQEAVSKRSSYISAANMKYLSPLYKSKSNMSHTFPSNIFSTDNHFTKMKTTHFSENEIMASISNNTDCLIPSLSDHLIYPSFSIDQNNDHKKVIPTRNNSDIIKYPDMSATINNVFNSDVFPSYSINKNSETKVQEKSLKVGSIQNNSDFIKYPDADGVTNNGSNNDARLSEANLSIDHLIQNILSSAVINYPLPDLEKKENSRDQDRSKTNFLNEKSLKAKKSKTVISSLKHANSFSDGTETKSNSRLSDSCSKNKSPKDLVVSCDNGKKMKCSSSAFEHQSENFIGPLLSEDSSLSSSKILGTSLQIANYVNPFFTEKSNILNSSSDSEDEGKLKRPRYF